MSKRRKAVEIRVRSVLRPVTTRERQTWLRTTAELEMTWDLGRKSKSWEFKMELWEISHLSVDLSVVNSFGVASHWWTATSRNPRATPKSRLVGPWRLALWTRPRVGNNDSPSSAKDVVLGRSVDWGRCAHPAMPLQLESLESLVPTVLDRYLVGYRSWVFCINIVAFNTTQNSDLQPISTPHFVLRSLGPSMWQNAGGSEPRLQVLRHIGRFGIARVSYLKRHPRARAEVSIHFGIWSFLGYSNILSFG